MARYRYISCHPVGRQQLHNSLRLIDPQWSWVVGGNGTLSAKITVPDDSQQVDKLRVATEPKQAAIYVRSNATGAYKWGGFVVGREWNPTSNQLTINCLEWRSWPYFTELTGLATDYWEYTGTDQLSIARSLMTANISQVGSPAMTFDTSQASGRSRDLSFWRTELKKVGSLIDSMADRDNGFEWTIESRSGSDGLPQLHFATSYPQRGSVITGLIFKHTPGGSNMVPGTIKEDVSQRVDAFYATGSGQPPAQPMGYDFNPEVFTGQLLRFDGGTNYSSVSDVSTLTSHARRARKFYQPGINLMEVELGLDRVDVDSYEIGDRGRLQFQDRWMTLDLPAVRIIEKKVSMAGAGKVTLTLDLSDATLPEVDAGGTV